MTTAKPTTVAQDRSFTVSRTIRAPAAKIFAAYTDPKQVAQWWAPKGGTLTVETMDVRVGGRYRYLQKTADGRAMTFVGSYVEVNPPTRLVYTFQVEGQPNAVTAIVDLAEAAGTTTVTLTNEFPSKDVRDAAMQYGALGGAKVALDNLGKFLGAA